MQDMINAFLEIAPKNQEELSSHLTKTFKEDFNLQLQEIEGGLFLDTNSDTTLIAHLDGYVKNGYAYPTAENIQVKANLISLINKDVNQVLTADDRAGIVAILELLKLGGEFNIIFSEDEEIGLVGISKMMDSLNVQNIIDNSKYIIELDKPMQKTNNNNLIKAFSLFCNRGVLAKDAKASGFVKKLIDEEFYSTKIRPTDIKVIANYLEENNLEQVFMMNLNAGYYSQHSAEEILDVKSLMDTVRVVDEFLAEED